MGKFFFTKRTLVTGFSFAAIVALVFGILIIIRPETNTQKASLYPKIPKHTVKTKVIQTSLKQKQYANPTSSTPIQPTQTKKPAPVTRPPGFSDDMWQHMLYMQAHPPLVLFVEMGNGNPPNPDCKTISVYAIIQAQAQPIIVTYHWQFNDGTISASATAALNAGEKKRFDIEAPYKELGVNGWIGGYTTFFIETPESRKEATPLNAGNYNLCHAGEPLQPDTNHLY